MKLTKLSLIFVITVFSMQDTLALDIKTVPSRAASAARGKVKKTRQVLGVVVPNVSERFRSKKDEFVANYWKGITELDKKVVVREGIALSSGEKEALAHRVKHNAQAIEKEFGTKKYIPKIALLCSGGGYRAMLITLGFLAGAQKIALLDMLTWIAGVSGGTWAIGSLMTKALSQNGDLDIADFAAEQAKLLDNKPLKPLKNEDYRAMSNSLIVQSINYQLFTPINLFGILLSNRIFGFLPPKDRQQQLLSKQSELAAQGQWPIPIYTAVNYEPQISAVDYRWIEFNPWEYGSSSLQAYAPIWGVSRMYDHGESINLSAESSFGYILGICGSAFAAAFQEMYKVIKNEMNPLASKIIENLLLTRYGHTRLAWAKLGNYTKGMASSPIENKNYINVIDAGFACNLPYQPLSGQRPERKPDILILLDSSTTPKEALQVAQQYAQKHNLKFPPIDYDGIDKRFISVFSDPNDADVPVVIYIWRMTDSTLLGDLDNSDFKELKQWVQDFDLAACSKKGGKCSFSSFLYDNDTMMRVTKTVEYQTRVSKSVIFDAIKQVIENKK